jgi:hypothetical protein
LRVKNKNNKHLKFTVMNITEQYEALTSKGLYNKGAYLIANAIGLKMKVGEREYKKYFPSDKDSRYVFKITLKKDGRQYTFNFGQSVAEGNNEPTLYNVLSCLQKYDVGSFEDFCWDFGYDEDSTTAERIYKAVVKEFQAMERLFNSDELELLTKNRQKNENK